MKATIHKKIECNIISKTKRYGQMKHETKQKIMNKIMAKIESEREHV